MGPSGKVRVLYVGGCGRSGSTLLDRMLSQVGGFSSVGEVVHLWRRGVRDNELCSCGRPFGECRFWLEVGRVAFGGWDGLDVDDVMALQRAVDRNRYIPFMLFPGLWPAYRERLRHYTAILFRLYTGIRHAVGGNVIIDSSKHASTAFLLRRVEGLDLRVIHLVRDSRGVAFSQMKRVQRPEVVGKEAYMPAVGAIHSSLQWMSYNSLFHALKASGVRTTFVRYESLVRDPRRQILRILERVGARADGANLEFIDGCRVTLRADHTVAGNPLRFRQGSVDLRIDDEWRRRMGRRSRALTSLLTWPLRVPYGYAFRGRP